jgi:hypothetical protein
MFEEQSKSKSRSVAPKILISSTVGILLSLGLCGLGAVSGEAKIAPFLFYGGFIVLGLSVLGFVVGIVWAVVEGFSSGDK